MTKVIEIDKASGDRPAQEIEIDELRVEVLAQWLYNHAEHCGCKPIPWPPERRCHLPMPAIVKDRVDPNVAYLLLLEAAGVSVGLRLQEPVC